MNQNIVVIFGTIDYGKKAFKDCSEFIIGLGGEVTIDVSSVTRKNCQMSIKVVFLQQLPFLLIKLAFKFLTSRDNFI